MTEHTYHKIILATILSLIPVGASPAGWIEYVDTFTAPTDRWWLGQANENTSARIEDGHYVYKSLPGFSVNGSPWLPNAHDDFDFDVTLRSVQTGETPFVSLLFGMKDFENFYFWEVNPKDGNYRYGKFMLNKRLTYRWGHEGIPTQSQLKNRTVMHLKISRRGEWLELFQEGISIDKFPFESFFGSSFGFGIFSDCKEIAVDTFIYRMETPLVPANETVRVVGNVSWPGEQGPVVARVYSPDTASVSTVRKGTNQHLEIELTDLQLIHGQRAGLSLQTKDGATLKLFCEDRCPQQGRPVTRKLHMVTLAGEKETGRKSVDLPSTTLGFKLALDRKGDRFMGSYTVGAEPKLMGSLKWPKLSDEQTHTCFFGYKGAAIDSVESPDHVEMTIEKMEF